eukprot:1194311-Prorocentrum_minimum.AAC.4
MRAGDAAAVPPAPPGADDSHGGTDPGQRPGVSAANGATSRWHGCGTTRSTGAFPPPGPISPRTPLGTIALPGGPLVPSRATTVSIRAGAASPPIIG